MQQSSATGSQEAARRHTERYTAASRTIAVVGRRAPGVPRSRCSSLAVVCEREDLWGRDSSSSLMPCARAIASTSATCLALTFPEHARLSLPIYAGRVWLSARSRRAGRRCQAMHCAKPSSADKAPARWMRMRASAGRPRASSSHTGKLPHHVVAAEALGEDSAARPSLSGPTFAKEVGDAPADGD